MEAIPSGPKKVECPEDDEFLNALDKMVSENIQDRMKESVKASNIDISVPVMVKSNKKTYDQLQVSKFIISSSLGQILFRRTNKNKIKLKRRSSTSNVP